MMKRHFLYLPLLAFALIVFAGCSEAQDQRQTSPRVIEGTHEILKEGQAAQQQRRQQEERMRQQILGDPDSTTVDSGGG